MEEIIKYLKEHIELCHELENMQSEKKVLQLVLKKVEKEAINYTHCCKSDSEQLPDVEKEKIIEDAYWLNLQNLSGREDFEKAFRLGIEVGVNELSEKLNV